MRDARLASRSDSAIPVCPRQPKPMHATGGSAPEAALARPPGPVGVDALLSGPGRTGRRCSGAARAAPGRSGSRWRPAAGRLPYWPAMLWCSSRSVWALGFTTVPAADWLPYWPAMLWRSSRSVWALGLHVGAGGRGRWRGVGADGGGGEVAAGGDQRGDGGDGGGGADAPVAAGRAGGGAAGSDGLAGHGVPPAGSVAGLLVDHRPAGCLQGACGIATGAFSPAPGRCNVALRD